MKAFHQRGTVAGLYRAEFGEKEVGRPREGILDLRDDFGRGIDSLDEWPESD